MKLQRSTRLALYAVLELADQPEQQLSRTEIAERFDISSNHLSKVMRELGRQGLVEAVRGVGGGYRFVGNAKRTTLLDIIELFEPSTLSSEMQREPGTDTEVGRTLDMVLGEINDTIRATLESISIKTMLMLKDRPRGQPTDEPAAGTETAL
jgi:Rrf2 family protein